MRIQKSGPGIYFGPISGERKIQNVWSCHFFLFALLKFEKYCQDVLAQKLSQVNEWKDEQASWNDLIGLLA